MCLRFEKKDKKNVKLMTFYINLTLNQKRNKKRERKREGGGGKDVCKKKKGKKITIISGHPSAKS